MKRILYVSFLSLSVFLTQAQRNHSDIELGIKGGMNLANLSVENSTNPDVKFSGYLGLLAHVHVARQFAIQPELYFSGQGAKETISGVDDKYALNYINLPILAQVMFAEGWRIETGPQVGILASARAKSQGSSVSINDDFKTFDFSWAFGVGYLTRSRFGFDARYNVGISNISDVAGNAVHNRVFSLGVFYQFSRL